MQHAASPTLHDFVLTLLTDETARTAFAADPTAALTGAGLHDVSAQDVRDVVPLVADYAPVDLHTVDLAGDPISGLRAVADAAHGAASSAAQSTDATHLTTTADGLSASAAGATAPAGYRADLDATTHSLSGGTILESDHANTAGLFDVSTDRVAASATGTTDFTDYRAGFVASGEGFASETSVSGLTTATDLGPNALSGGLGFTDGPVDTDLGLTSTATGAAGAFTLGTGVSSVDAGFAASQSGLHTETPLGDLDFTPNLPNTLIDASNLADTGSLTAGATNLAGTVTGLTGAALANPAGTLGNVTGAVTGAQQELGGLTNTAHLPGTTALPNLTDPGAALNGLTNTNPLGDFTNPSAITGTLTGLADTSALGHLADTSALTGALAHPTGTLDSGVLSTGSLTFTSSSTVTGALDSDALNTNALGDLTDPTAALHNGALGNIADTSQLTGLANTSALTGLTDTSDLTGAFGDLTDPTTALDTSALGSVTDASHLAGFDGANVLADPTAALDQSALGGTDALPGFVDPSSDPTAALDALPLAGTLDTDAVRGGDLTAGTVADYVSSGGALLGSTAGLGGYLTSASQAGPHVLPADTSGLESAVHQLPVSDLPAQLPQLPAVPDLGHLPVPVPEVHNLPVDHLPTDLPHLPELPHLPVVDHLPDLPVANPLPDVASGVQDSVGGLVDHAPLGDAADHLPDVGGVVGDLGLGH
ncbi:IniB N-terminal domain-containing protein [Actinokineospora enzanensis]|uniref:IniB N-terminal domain-containing protein n=1 Tax=Actinokineospora enzanensis TaxID=155975 RepID=UPI0003A90519|nr:IniB N-terminal domain-containing protein [Actinokineospora enzanensis]